MYIAQVRKMSAASAALNVHSHTSNRNAFSLLLNDSNIIVAVETRRSSH